MIAASETMEPMPGRDFASGEARISIFGGLSLLCMAALSLEDTEESVTMATILAAFGCYQIWMGYRSFKKPYIRLHANQLIVFEYGKPKHYIDLAQVQSWKKGLNRTILLMRDGLRISISHMNFIKSEDATAFRTALAERVASPVTA